MESIEFTTGGILVVFNWILFLIVSKALVSANFSLFVGPFIGLSQFKWNDQMGKSTLARAIVINGSITFKGKECSG